MGDKDQGQPSRNIAPNQPIFTGLFTVPTADPSVHISIPVTFAQFTEAFMVSITAHPSTDPADPLQNVALQFLIGGQGGANGNAVKLEGAEFILPAENYVQTVPAWLNRIIIDARGVLVTGMAPPESRADVTFTVVVYQMDRTTRDEWKGR